MFPCPVQTKRENERRKERRGKEREEGLLLCPNQTEKKREGKEKRKEKKERARERESCDFRERERKKGAFPVTTTSSNGIFGEPTTTQTPLASMPRAVFAR